MSSKKVLVVLARPNTDRSFNRAIAETAAAALAAQGYEPVLSDLYAEKFDPVLPPGEERLPIDELPDDLRRRIADVKDCAGTIFVHPNWWGSVPAILKGWLDRVLRSGFAYGFTEKGPWQGLTDKIVQVFSTSNTPRDVEVGVYGDPLEAYWKKIVFGLCGCKSFERRNFEPIITSDEKQRAAWLAEVDATVRRRFPKID